MFSFLNGRVCIVLDKLLIKRVQSVLKQLGPVLYCSSKSSSNTNTPVSSTSVTLNNENSSNNTNTNSLFGGIDTASIADYCTDDGELDPILWYNEPSDRETGLQIAKDLHVYEEFLSDDEEKKLCSEIEPYISRLHYEYDHWDNAIHGFRETEKKHWSQENNIIIQRMKDIAFPPGDILLPYVHVLDVAKNGYIKPHIDSTRFCGSIIAGICLLSPCVMKLVHEKNPEKWVKVLLKQRALYIMKGLARYDYTHAILSEEESIFKGAVVPRDRRISIICRNEKQDDDD
ncbi:alpha-ketoglutarate-dependent dioxygenase alkB homolog 7, mitochondrial-like [Tubulanus polymorphus]|uniref:alpha-ketoglutarate-dependent dioxygenase alkB homolog 7, mitochondrial-like n=1 Tax=Tubulanus polymorphus TaxID=672921 RepID=UPI003DA58E01